MIPPIERFRKRPIVVDTILWDGTVGRLAAMLAWIGHTPTPCGAPPVLYNEQSGLRVWNAEENQYIDVPIGHRVVKGQLGEHYPISPEAVENTYIAVED
jgi:hypothetical protein